jgi:ABC-type transporter Mla maintaining outer membrane lipid asymmetry permease subunit MlaE
MARGVAVAGRRSNVHTNVIGARKTGHKVDLLGMMGFMRREYSTSL